jgi:hypothetical protein
MATVLLALEGILLIDYMMLYKITTRDPYVAGFCYLKVTMEKQ